MLDLTKQEKIILLFLSLSFAVGLGITSYKKARQKIELDIQPAKLAALKDTDQLIAQEASININSLEVNELKRLPGVGEAIAQNIVAYHALHGPFSSKEELMQVKGIGEKKFEQLKASAALE